MKSNQKSKTQKSSRVPKLIGIGGLDLQYELILTDDDLSASKMQWEKIEKISDLSFLSNKKDLWNKIKLLSNNYMMNFLLFLNKSQQLKSFVEFIAFEGPTFSEEEFFMNEIVTYVTEHNFIFLNEGNFAKYPVKMTFTVKYGKNSRCFVLSKPKEGEGRNAKSEPTEDEMKEDKGNADEKQDKKSNPFSKIKCLYGDFDYMYLDLEDFIDLQHDGKVPLENLQKFLEHLKASYGISLIIKFPDVVDRVSEITADSLKSLMNILFITDIFIFEKKEAYYLFNMLYHFRSADEKGKDLDQKKYIDYFTNEIAYGGALSSNHPKVGLFLDEFQKLTMVEVRKGDISIVEYDSQIYPKVNHTNQKLVDEYKCLLLSEYGYYKSIFFGALIGKYLQWKTSKKESNGFYSSYLTGIESVKRILELEKNEMELPNDPEFYIVVIPKSKIKEQIQSQNLKNKEDKFVLDCVNRSTSKLKFYNPLFDDHLNSFFASGIVRKELKSKGFINTNGFIMYDPVYRSVMGSSPKSKKDERQIEKEKKLLNTIRKMKVTDDLSFKEMDSYRKMRSSNSPINKKLPAMQFEYAPKRGLSNQVNCRNKFKPIQPVKNEQKSNLEMNKKEVA